MGGSAVIDFLFGFQGRIQRLQWWLAQLGSLAIAVLIFLAFAYWLGGRTTDSATTFLAGSVGIAGYVALAWVQLAVAVKRLHDQGRSGWFYLINFVPFVGSLILLVMLGFRDSVRGDNRFGGSKKHPRAEHAAAVFD